MGITKTDINGDFSVLQSFLQSTGFFDTVELGTNTVTMKDAGGNTLATIDGATITVYANASNSANYNYTTNSPAVKDGYKCANGILLKFAPLTGAYQDKQAHVLITKTNNNKIAFIFSNTSNNNTGAPYTNYQCIAWGDTDIAANTYTAKAGEQTLLCPFCTNATLGEPSYTPNAFWIPFGQNYSMGYGTLAMNGVTYLTNGYWCIKDV